MFLFRFFGLDLLYDKSQGLGSHRELRLINLLWIFIHIVVFIFLTVSQSSHIFTRSYTLMSELIELASYLFALATNLIILVHAHLAKKVDATWRVKLSELDRLICDKYHVKINHEAIVRWNMWKLAIIFSAAVACSVINMLFAARSGGNTPLLFAHTYFFKAIINLRYIQSFIRIDLIKQRIVVVHEAVRKVVEQNTVEWKIVLVLDTFNRHRRVPVGKIDDADDVAVLKRSYATLFELMKLWESCFGWSLLMMIFFSFIDLTSNLYWFFFAILNLDARMYLIDCALEIMPSVVIISCLMYSSFDANRKAKELINSVVRLYTNTTSIYNKLVKEFLMQIHHERIENSANDFFIVDFHLLSAVSTLASSRWRVTSCNA